MNKTQLVALFLAGAAAGAGGVSAVKLAQTSDAPPQRRVHALDLRVVAQLPDGGVELRRIAYGSLLFPDGGTKDIGQAKKCADSSAAAQAAMRAAMELAVTDCEWP